MGAQPSRPSSSSSPTNNDERSDVYSVDRLISRGINDLDEDGMTALIFASHLGHLKMVQFLISTYGPDLRVKDVQGASCLFRAAEEGHMEVVKCLMEKCPSLIHEPDYEGRTPLWMALINGHFHIVDYFLAKVPKNLVLETMSRIFTKGQTIDTTAALIWAGISGHLDITKYLVEEQNVDVMVKCKSGNTSFFVASVKKHLDVMKYLLEKNPTLIDEGNNEGRTPLWMASYYNNHEIVDYLLEEGADTEVQAGARKRTALMVAAETNSIESLKLLIDKGQANLHEKEHWNGHTALHSAASMNHLEAVKILLDKEPALIDAPDSDGCSPLWLAAFLRYPEIVKCLLEKGADVNKKTYHQEFTPLIAACASNYCPKRVQEGMETIEALVEQGGANLNEVSSGGKSAIFMAALKDHVNIVEYLMRKGAFIGENVRHGFIHRG